MKKRIHSYFFLIAIVISIVTIQNYAHHNQSDSLWQKVDGGVSEALLCIHFIDDKNGWALGFGGTYAILIQTSDSGKTWNKINLPMSHRFFDVTFTDKNNGWVVGDSGVILQTRNGGVLWEKQPSNTIKDLKKVYFSTTQIGWILGEKGTILKTTDGGIAWEKFELINTNIVRSIHFLNDTIGWICGNGEREINKTTDGGVNWSKPYQKIDSLKCNLNSIYSIDERRIFVGGIKTDGICLLPCAKVTTDNGLNWADVNIDTLPQQVSTIMFHGELSGYIAGNSNKIYETTDGGTNWTYQVISDDKAQIVNEIIITSNGTAWAVGSNGLILKRKVSATNIKNLNKSYTYRQEKIAIMQTYDKIYLQFDFLKPSSFLFSLTDVKGRCLFSSDDQIQLTGSNMMTIPKNILHPGIYFLSITMGDEQKRVKVFVFK